MNIESIIENIEFHLVAGAPSDAEAAQAMADLACWTANMAGVLADTAREASHEPLPLSAFDCDGCGHDLLGLPVSGCDCEDAACVCSREYRIVLGARNMLTELSRHA